MDEQPKNLTEEIAAKKPRATKTPEEKAAAKAAKEAKKAAAEPQGGESPKPAESAESQTATSSDSLPAEKSESNPATGAEPTAAVEPEKADPAFVVACRKFIKAATEEQKRIGVAPLPSGKFKHAREAVAELGNHLIKGGYYGR